MEVCETFTLTQYVLFIHILIKPITFNISIDPSFLNIVSLLLTHLRQIIQKTNVSLKMSNILGALDFRHLLYLIQQIYTFYY